MMMKGC